MKHVVDLRLLLIDRFEGLQPDQVKMPHKDQYGKNAIPLLKRLTFQNDHLPAMQQVCVVIFTITLDQYVG